VFEITGKLMETNSKKSPRVALDTFAMAPRNVSESENDVFCETTMISGNLEPNLLAEEL
jgi:hypothetical protein